ncbi:MAG: hypothetical protein IPL97_11355 [Niastella sp.]|nr:hypothetical protein [Niastella sp.]
MKNNSRYFFILLSCICFYATNLFAQEQTISDEKLWYLDTKLWLLAAGIVLLILYGFYRMFKPSKKKITEPGTPLPFTEPPTDISRVDKTEDTGINENPGS